jgi:hypothetical protein
VPEWDGIKLEDMRDRRAEKRAHLALLAAVVLLVAPLLFLGRAWGVAVWRVVNPFSSVMPATLTRIVDVQPGDATVLQGSSLLLTCSVNGWAGHRVWVDVEQADQTQVTYALGRIVGKDQKVEAFSHRLPKVNTALRYRFRAGDAAFPAWHAIKTRPPLAFTAWSVTITPPDYTALPARKAGELTENLDVPAGSTVDVQAKFNLPLKSAQLIQGGTNLALQLDAQDGSWRGRVSVSNAAPITLSALGQDGDQIDQVLRLGFQPDRLPAIEVLAPEGRPVLAPGAAPAIAFTVADDYGVAEVTIEEVDPQAGRDATGAVVQAWQPVRQTRLSTNWKATSPPAFKGESLAYRIVARDNAPGGMGERIVRSSLISFSTPSVGDAAKQRDQLENDALSTLARVIELQKQNLDQTKACRANATNTTTAAWKETTAAQREIHGLTKKILDSPLNPLGRMAGTVKELYLNEMSAVIPVLAGMPDTAMAERAARADNAVRLEEKILRQLSRSEDAAEDAKVDRRVAAISGMITDMIKRQAGVLKDTQVCAEKTTKVGAPLVDRQDTLATDVAELGRRCRAEAAVVKGNDVNFAQLLGELATACESLKIREDMVLAAAKLEENQPKDAEPKETDALAKLKQLLAKLDEVQARDDAAEEEEVLAAIEEAKERFAKLADAQRKALEAMEMVGEQKDKSSKDTDLMEEEYKELLKNMEEALLQVPTDLNIFMDLNVANDIVEDVVTVFEEIQQAAGSEDLKAGDVKERALAKREEYLEQMEEAKDRLDDMEKWLADKPDDMKITAEAFDKAEMPQAGIALGALATETEDLIGDLLKKQEDMSKEADDGAINTAVPDMVASAEVKEGDVTSFAAQGASGNETPDHKEQDGRSNVGRQGMAVGETAAGSGTINKGDENIEARRTQDPTQSGQVDAKGDDVKTKATGGGKLGTGKADELGMEGGVKRMDSTEAGSREGMDSLLARRADELYAKASLQNVRTDSLKDASHHLRQAADAVARGDIGQLREQRKLAVVSLRTAKAQIDATAVGTFSMEQVPTLVDDVVEGGPELAPAQYRDLVAEYYKALNKEL